MLTICALAYFASGAANLEVQGLPDRFHLACSGTMAAPADSPTTSQILADGQVDIVGGNVNGFGLGGQSIYLVSDTHIAFGSGIGGRGNRLIEGSIDRQTLATRILVGSMHGVETPMMTMRLDCRMTPPLA